MEGTLATAFRNSLVVAIADLMDNGKSQEPEQTTAAKPSNRHRLESQQQQQQQSAKIQSISKSSSSHCSPYDTLYWLGGDCIRKATSLATIAECTTMKTDNTTEVFPATKDALVANIVSPAKSRSPESNSSISSTNITNSNTEKVELPQQIANNTNNSISSGDMNINANANIISQYHQQYSNPKALFDGYADYMDYTDPANSMLVEDYTDSTKNCREDSKTTETNNSHSDYLDKSNRKSGSKFFCNTPSPEPEAENWFSVSPVSTTAWCGGYSSLHMYSKDEDKNENYQQLLQKQQEMLQQQNPEDYQYPEYYAEFKPQRQYAFDEEDGDYSASMLTPTRALLDGISTTAETATANDGDSLVTSVSSIQSFMVINRPHTMNHNISPLMTHNKLQRKGSSSSQRIPPKRDHHLHELISSPGPSVAPTLADSDSENIAFDYALTQSLMRKLKKHLPYGKRGDSFWLQYSLIRDGASLNSLLDMVHRDVNNTTNHICSVLAIETVEGEVFGAFLTQTWRRSYKQWYGGGQSFLWTTAPETSEKGKKLRVFPYSFENSYVQLCDRDRLLVGGGDGGDSYDRHCYGFGLALEKDLLTGSSCPCTTFESPSLSKIHSDGSIFEIRNLEVWTLTPCLSVIENPSEGLVRVHKLEANKKRKQEIEKLASSANQNASNEEKSKRKDDDDSYEGFYNCYSQSNCRVEIDDWEDGRDLAAHSFPGANTAICNRNTRRHNKYRRKNRNKYVSCSPST